MDHPGLFGFLALTTDEKVELPDPKTPYYILAEDGIYYHRTLLIGEALTPLKQMPGHLKPTGMKQGAFIFTAEPIPAAICAQAVSFFRRIYDRHKTEAEVYITQNHQTRQYRLFIPNQTCTGASVHSQFDAAHISRNWQLVGTMHSHCMMSAFHSGTDTNDASTLDGIHITVGKVMDDVPDIAAMVSVDGHHYTYKPEQLADFSDLAAGTAPEWWDRYVTKVLPAPIKPFHTSATKDWATHYTPKNHATSQWWEDFHEPESMGNYYQRMLDAARKPTAKPVEKPKDKEEVSNHTLYDGTIEDGLANIIILSSVTTDEDLDESCDWDTEDWRDNFLLKLDDLVSTLKAFNVDVSYFVETDTTTEDTENIPSNITVLPEQLPGQLIAFKDLS
jgi:PRTRC genetic system protein A